eukprot:TRINITY_DN17019_c0_g1_i2.p1 TRINITY_DN17019_c0_g1~~TRINITY_DN17019_c0_g1_i2.p1  ORF type:complete len:327 (+),score=39.23 TRINITY_DN17019_c0_g1_i2:171-1151(+)
MTQVVQFQRCGVPFAVSYFNTFKNAFQMHFLSNNSSNETGFSDFAALEVALGPSVGENLLAKGYAVIDNVLDVALCKRFRAEIMRLRDAGKLHHSNTHLTLDDVSIEYPKAGMFETEVTYNKSLVRLAPTLTRWAEDKRLRAMINAHLPMLRLDSQSMSVEYSIGTGACDPMHTDCVTEKDNREITAIFYLNQDWSEQDGGQLRLYPWPNQPVDIQPLHNRLVIFSSRNMVHRMLPTKVQSCSFTTSMSDKRKKMQWVHNQVSLRDQLRSALENVRSSGTFHDVWRLLVQPQVRMQVIKYIYQKEWERSIHEAHKNDAQQTQQLLE